MKQSISAVKVSDETECHLPISFALAGIYVKGRAFVPDAYARTSYNPIIATECLLSEKTGRERKEPSQYSGVKRYIVIRKLGYSLVGGSICRLSPERMHVVFNYYKEGTAPLNPGNQISLAIIPEYPEVESANLAATLVSKIPGKTRHELRYRILLRSLWHGSKKVIF